MSLDRAQVVRDLLGALHGAATVGQRLFLARFGRERLQFGHGMLQPVTVGLSRGDLRSRRVQCAFRSAQPIPGPRRVVGVDPPETVEQRAMSGRRQQPAIVMLAVDFDEVPSQLAQQRGRGRLIVDEGAAAPVRLDQTAHDQRLPRLNLKAVVRQQRAQGIALRVEARGHHRLRRAMADQSAVAPRSQRQSQRVEQDRLARPRLAGQHAQSGIELQVQRLDQHHVTNGKRGQHRRRI